MYDVEGLKKQIDLREFAGKFTTLEAKTRTEQELTGPCPVCAGHNRFNVQKARWLCRKCSGGKWLDVIHLGALLWNLNTKDDFRELCERLGAPETYCSVPNKANNTAQVVDDSPPSQDWQKRAAVVVATCSNWLWEPVGDKARAYLLGRGLDEFALAHFQLGFCPEDQTIAGHFVQKGILIPHFGAGHLWGVKIRRPSNKPGEKYRSIAGSKQNLYGANYLANKQAAFVVEGEFDAMLLHWEICDLAAVITLGSASGTLGGRWLPALLPVKRFYIATDNDEAGQEAAAKWLNLVRNRGQVVTIPEGKDITDYHLTGGDLRAWALEWLELHRLKWQKIETEWHKMTH